MPLTTPPCTPAHIIIVADGANGDFTGMSHGGTWLFLRNGGARACRLPALPLVRLLDRRGRSLPAIRRPAPTGTPVIVAAGHRVRLSLRWVSGPVYDHSRCLTATRVTVAGATGRLTARLCGPAGAPIRFEQTAIAPIEDYPAE